MFAPNEFGAMMAAWYEPLAPSSLTASPVTPMPTPSLHPAFCVVHGVPTGVLPGYGAPAGVMVVPSDRPRSVERRRSVSVERRQTFGGSLSYVPAPEAPKTTVVRQRSADSLRPTPRLGSFEATQAGPRARSRSASASSLTRVPHLRLAPTVPVRARSREREPPRGVASVLLPAPTAGVGVVPTEGTLSRRSSERSVTASDARSSFASSQHAPSHAPSSAPTAATAARVLAHHRLEIQTLQSQVEELRKENAQLREQSASRTSSLERRAEPSFEKPPVENLAAEWAAQKRELLDMMHRVPRVARTDHRQVASDLARHLARTEVLLERMEGAAHGQQFPEIEKEALQWQATLSCLQQSLEVLQRPQQSSSRTSSARREFSPPRRASRPPLLRRAEERRPPRSEHEVLATTQRRLLQLHWADFRPLRALREPPSPALGMLVHALCILFGIPPLPSTDASGTAGWRDLRAHWAAARQRFLGEPRFFELVQAASPLASAMSEAKPNWAAAVPMLQQLAAPKHQTVLKAEYACYVVYEWAKAFVAAAAVVERSGADALAEASPSRASASMPHERALSPSRASLSQHVVAESPEPRGAELVEERSSSELSRSTARRLF